jgi:phage-related protein (TIGR01555 family)
VGRPQQSRYEADAVYAHSGIIARAIDLPPQTCLAKGFTIGEISGDDVTSLESYLTGIDAYRSLARASQRARQYGGAIVFMQINDGRPANEPVSVSSINSMGRLLVFDTTEVQVISFGETIGSDYFGEPEFYRITVQSGGSFDAHASRCLHFDGVPVGRSQKFRTTTNRGFSPSFVDRMWSSFEAYGSTNQYFNKTIENLTQGVLKLTDLNTAMKGGNAKDIGNRLRMIIDSMSTIGDVVIDKDESYEITSRNVTGFLDAATVFVDWLVADSGIPRSILMGQTSGGLSDGNNGGDWDSFATSCGTMQMDVFEPLVKKLLRYVLASKNSPIKDAPQAFTISWPSILQMSEKEKAEIYSLRAPGRASDIMAGVISPIEARKSDDVIDAYHLDSQPEIEPEDEDEEETIAVVA